jgi:cell division septum initiation protein DivIVA
MEHIVLQWDDIVEKLFDELVQEEVQELNKIEYKRSSPESW